MSILSYDGWTRNCGLNRGSAAVLPHPEKKKIKRPSARETRKRALQALSQSQRESQQRRLNPFRTRTGLGAHAYGVPSGADKVACFSIKRR